MRIVLFIALGGAAGALGRYFVSGWTHKLFGESFPYGTLAVNLLGSFLLGILVHVALAMSLSPEWRAGLVVGVLGALTTFSTFALETVERIEQGQYGVAISNVAVNLTLCLVAVWLGLVIARSCVSAG